MAREKKINVKPLLNTAVKPTQDSPLEEPKYPLYLEVTYNRKYTKFPFGDSRFPLSQSDKLSSDKTIKKAIAAVEKIIRFEAERRSEFTITGLSDIIKSYLSNLGNSIMHLLVMQIAIELKSVLIASEYDKWKSENYIERIPKGLDLLGENASDKIQELLTAIQLSLLEARGLIDRIIDWQIHTERDVKIALVERGIKQDLSGLLFADKGGLIKKAKKCTPSQLVDIIDKCCCLVVDNQIVTRIKY